MKTTNQIEKLELESCLEGLIDANLEYLHVMHFLSDIRNYLNDAYKNREYTLDGLKKTADFIETQIDGFGYKSNEVSNISFELKKAYSIIKELTNNLN